MIVDANGKRYLPPHDGTADVLAEHLDEVGQRLAATINAHLYGTHPDDLVRELRKSVLGVDDGPSRIAGLEATIA